MGCNAHMGRFAPGALCAKINQNTVLMDERGNKPVAGVLETHDIGIAGMACDNCVRRVEKALRGIEGVKEVRVDRSAALATVTFDTTKTRIPELHDVLLKSGYRPAT